MVGSRQSPETIFMVWLNPAIKCSINHDIRNSFNNGRHIWPFILEFSHKV